ncbi:MAG: hypothetical protein DWQ36_08020 [Acidobacteria bacterium]|nr:MAG: hypothetical protein DWQ30_03805 [Acidobacteriota bacterium]REK08909.1 MAG: hypothetical protein DWQ36_08020 [Acidobacteriota bacterium]
MSTGTLGDLLGTAKTADRLLDGAVVAFAVWTLSCHFVVFVGGSFEQLIQLASLVLVVAVGTLIWRRKRTSERRTTSDPLDDLAIRGLRQQLATRPPLSPLVPAALTIVGLLAWQGASAWRWLLVTTALSFCVIWSWRAERTQPETPPEPPIDSRWTRALPWGLGVVASCLALLAHRPDYDDSFYINIAVTALDHPAAPLLRGDSMHGIAGLPIHLTAYRVHSIELLQAAIARLTGLSPMLAAHWVVAALAAFAVPLAHARLLRIVTPAIWPWTLAATLVALIAVGDPHRWYGNFALVRIWQGKSVFLSVLVPLLFVHAFRFAARPDRRSWALLVCGQVAAIGLTSSALPTAPCIVVLGLMAALPASLSGARRLLLGSLSAAYLLVVGLILRSSVLPPSGHLASASSNGERDSVLETVVGTGPLLPLSLVCMLVAWTMTRSALARRFALLPGLATWLVFLNPTLEPWVRNWLTGTVGWRALWILPLPSLIALVLTAPLVIRGVRSAALRATTVVVAISAFVLWIPSFSSFSVENRSEWRFPPGAKVNAPYEWAGELNRLVPAGSFVAAPDAVGQWVPTFRRHAFPLSVRHYLKAQRRHLPSGEFAERERIKHMLDGRIPDGLSAGMRSLREGLDRYELAAVCVRVHNNRFLDSIRDVLAQGGFRRVRGDGTFEIWVHDEP